jgi:Rhodopirellula transposase DDE domain
VSLDTKAGVKVGLYSRHGKTRAHLQAADPDFKPDAVLTPFGMFLPDLDEVYLYMTASSVTADFRVDCLRDFWLLLRCSFPQVTTLLINLDNGPENHSRRSQFMARLARLADACGLTIRLAYYPPDYSKYNPIARVWGVLEQHWNGDLLDSPQTLLRLASTMTWNGFAPIITFVQKTYQTAVHLSQQAMAALEKRLVRLPTLPKWFVEIVPQSG